MPRQTHILTLVLCALLIFGCTSRPATNQFRIATFNAASGLPQAGELQRRLDSGNDEGLRALAAILQAVRPDIVLLNEFDRLQGYDNAAVLLQNYLSVSQHGQRPIDYGWHWQGPVNTGVPSGLDLDGDGVRDGPADAWGFGRFPGQYAMLVLSRFPIESDAVRTFRLMPWSQMPGVQAPRQVDGTPFYDPETWRQLRLSSKTHADVPVLINGRRIHVLVSHPTPPVFDGPEDRNGLRNYDEIRLWADYLDNQPFLIDDAGQRGGLEPQQPFVILGDLNADPADGDSRPGAIAQLLQHPQVNSGCVPRSEGGLQASRTQGGINASQLGDPASDTADFSDQHTGNLRIDYVLPSRDLNVGGCGVFWPPEGTLGSRWLNYSDHRLVWTDIRIDDN
ncbi:MAG: endonuclease/exonuclease/phosphatase family protein [Xanthomonadales bacterium]|nr:endonuclease/exonuclease/phosphatase family protein [Xanthomonadales bacterium]